MLIITYTPNVASVTDILDEEHQSAEADSLRFER